MNIGEVPRALKILIDGSVFVVSDIGVFDQISVEARSPNKVFGMTEMISRSPVEYTVIAATRCRVDSIDDMEFERFLQSDGAFMTRLIRSIAEEVQAGLRLLRLMLQ